MDTRSDRIALVLVVAGLIGVATWSFLSQGWSMASRGGRPVRTVDAGSIYGAALDVTGGQCTPEHMQGVWGPRTQSGDWRPHRVTYPYTPGYELERLILGAPGVCNTVTPRADRGWLFAPPSEVDY